VVGDHVSSDRKSPAAAPSEEKKNLWLERTFFAERKLLQKETSTRGEKKKQE